MILSRTYDIGYEVPATSRGGAEVEISLKTPLGKVGIGFSAAAQGCCPRLRLSNPVVGADRAVYQMLTILLGADARTRDAGELGTMPSQIGSWISY
ncbi:hypothetical protein PG989_007264 [Apiospora arundinis]